MKILKTDVIKEYEKSSKIENRMVGVGINDNGPDIEYHFFPELNELKLIVPDIDTCISIEASLSDIGISEETEESFNQKKLADFVKIKTHDDDFPIKNIKWSNVERDFLVDGFIHVPSRFLFNNQQTTDNIVITQNEKGEKGILIIDRKLPPTGWAMAGGMVDEAAIKKAAELQKDASELNAHDELEEELGLKEVKIVPLSEEYTRVDSFEVRGSMSTRVTVFDSPGALVDKLATAGDDASDFKFITFEELFTLLKRETLVKDGIEIKLVPHHRDILANTFSLESRKVNNELDSLIEEKLVLDNGEEISAVKFRGAGQGMTSGVFNLKTKYVDNMPDMTWLKENPSEVVGKFLNGEDLTASTFYSYRVNYAIQKANSLGNFPEPQGPNSGPMNR